MIYLDHNATTPIAPEVFDAMRPYLTTEWGNPSSPYSFGSKLKSVLETARAQVATLIGAAYPGEILFTSCATESNATAIRSALTNRPGKKHIITSTVEHSSILANCAELARNGYEITYLPVDREGLLLASNVEAAIRESTALVSLMWANNETGVLFPVEHIAKVCKARDVLFHCDAVQAVGKLPVNVAALSVDYLSISGHKISAPKGIGALYTYRKAPFAPFLHGGHQERGRRGGTENVALAVGLGAAAALSTERVSQYSQRVSPLRDSLETQILRAVSSAERNGAPHARISNTTSITFHAASAEALLLLLDQEGICASSGSACLADSHEPSHVILAMKPETVARRETIRFSLGWDTTAHDVARAVSSTLACVAALTH